MILDGEISLKTEIAGEVSLKTEAQGDPGIFVPVQPILQAKETAPTEEVQTLTPDQGYNGLSAVTVDAIPGNYVGSQVPRVTSLIASGKTVLAPEGYAPMPLAKSVDEGSVIMPLEIISADPSVSVDDTGLITATVSKSGSLHPIVTKGWVESVGDGSYGVHGTTTHQLPTEAGRLITPTRSQQDAILKGRIALDDIKVDKIPDELIDTTDADAVALDIRSGKTAYVNGSKLTGLYNYFPYGDEAELLKTYADIDGCLKDDTTFDSWAASPTAGTIKSYTTAGTFTADFDNYEYVAVWDGWVKLAHLAGATLKVMPQEFAGPMNCWILRRPTTVANVQADNFATNTYSNGTLGYLFYYNSSGTYSMANTTYGVYWSIQAPTFSSTSAAKPTVTVRTPILQARCSTSYFATARKVEIDSENSYFHMSGKLYRIAKGSGYMTRMWHRVVDEYNKARNYVPEG